MDWSEEPALDEKVLDKYAPTHNSEEAELMLIVDVQRRAIIAFSRRLHHRTIAAQYLRLHEDDLSTQNASHIVGATIVIMLAKDGYWMNAYVGGSSLTTQPPEKEIRYTQKTLTDAMKIVTDFIYRSPLRIKRRSVEQSVRAAA